MSEVKVKKDCGWCGKPFVPRKGTSRFCSRSCAKRRPPSYKKCRYCNQQYAPKEKFHQSMYCSRKCGGLGRRKQPIEKKCPQCGKMFSGPKNIIERQIFCSSKCSHLNLRRHRAIIKCACCGKQFDVYKKIGKRAVYKFCSTKCAGKYRHNEALAECEACGKRFIKKNTDSRYCSLVCYADERRQVEKIKCGECGKLFMQSRIKEKYCSQSCAGKSTTKKAWEKGLFKNMKKNPEAQSEAAKANWASGKFEGTSCEAGPNHHAGRIWRLRDPNNRTYQFKNLCEFVRNHPELFDPDDVIWGDGKPRAVSGLQSISARSKHAHCSWKGWTWFSQTERLHNSGNDLLDRTTAKELC